MDYVEVTDWGDDAWASDVTGVAVDTDDRVYVLRRGDEAVTVLRPDGNVVDQWANTCFSARPHFITVQGAKAYVADDGGHRVFIFNLRGQLLEVIGSGEPSLTGVEHEGKPSPANTLDQVNGGPPFNRPTKAAPGPGGELFVSDGYRNCRVHRFSADRQTVYSWGGPGGDAGSFVIPHSVTLDARGQIFVCDRENDRIQVFARDGTLVDVWNEVQRPTDVAFDRNGYMYVAELARGPLDVKSWRLGPASQEIPGQITVFAPDRTVAARIAHPNRGFLAPHAIAVDSSGAIYLSEVPESFAKSTGRPLRSHRCLRKFKPRQG